MKELIDRIFRNWQTTLAGLLIAAGQIWTCVHNGGAIFGCIEQSWPVIVGVIGLGFWSRK